MVIFLLIIMIFTVIFYFSQLARFIDQQSRAGNPVAQAVASLKLSENIVVLKLGTRPPAALGGEEAELFSDESGDESDDFAQVDMFVYLLRFLGKGFVSCHAR